MSTDNSGMWVWAKKKSLLTSDTNCAPGKKSCLIVLYLKVYKKDENGKINIMKQHPKIIIKNSNQSQKSALEQQATLFFLQYHGFEAR